MKLSGKCQSKDGYSRAYIGKPGLTAQLLSVLEGVEFTRGSSLSRPARVDMFLLRINAWRRRRIRTLLCPSRNRHLIELLADGVDTQASAFP